MLRRQRRVRMCPQQPERRPVRYGNDDRDSDRNQIYGDGDDHINPIRDGNGQADQGAEISNAQLFTPTPFTVDPNYGSDDNLDLSLFQHALPFRHRPLRIPADPPTRRRKGVVHAMERITAIVSQSGSTHVMSNRQAVDRYVRRRAAGNRDFTVFLPAESSPAQSKTSKVTQAQNNSATTNSECCRKSTNPASVRRSPQTRVWSRAILAGGFDWRWWVACLVGGLIWYALKRRY